MRGCLIVYVAGRNVPGRACPGWAAYQAEIEAKGA